MGFYDAFKDVVNLAQKADNLELYRQLLDLSAQALDLQEENIKLKEEIYNLSKEKEVERHIVRHAQPFITLDDDEQNLPYCAVCWTKEKSYIKWEEKSVMVKSKLFVETVVIVAIMRYENENI